MNIVLWIVAGLLALAFLAAGAMKLAQPKEKIAASPNTKWAEDFAPAAIKLIAAAEVLGALGLILPAALGVATVLTPLAATGLALVMAGAIVTHVRRHEPQALPINVILLVLAVFVAVCRFGPYAF